MRLLSGLFTDCFSGIKAPEYFMLITDESCTWCRIGCGGRLRVLLKADNPGGSHCILDDFCNKIASHASYFGQPCRIIAGGSCGYTYIKRLRMQTPAQLLASLRIIHSDATEVRQISRPIGKSRCFVYEAIDKQTLDRILMSTTLAGLAVTDVVLLPVQLVLGSPPADGNTAVINIYTLSDKEIWFMLSTPGDDVLVERVPESCVQGSAKLTVEALRAMYVPQCETVSGKHYSTVCNRKQPGTCPLPLSRVLVSRLKTNSAICSLTYRPTSWRRAEALRIALNASRLLGLALSAILLLLSVAVGLTTMWAGQRAERIDAFQEKYAAKAAMTHTVDSLASEWQTVAARAADGSNIAPVLSAFCQHSVGGLSLTGIRVTSANSDSLTAVIEGIARSARAVFDYRTLVCESVRAFALKVGSVRPEVSVDRGDVDSLYSFTMMLSRYERTPQE
jgi:hypothetical protein